MASRKMVVEDMEKKSIPDVVAYLQNAGISVLSDTSTFVVAPGKRPEGRPFERIGRMTSILPVTVTGFTIAIIAVPISSGALAAL